MSYIGIFDYFVHPVQSVSRVGDDEKSNVPFYERRAFQGTAAIVALATALLALVGPLKGVVDELFPSTEPVTWVEIVLDTSAAMEEEFDGVTKFEAANEAIRKAIKELDNSGLGLRRTATTCDGRSEQVVPLGGDHGDDVIDEARDLRPEGESSIVDAVVGGLEQFNREPMASRGPESRQLLVFTTAAGECSDDDLAKELEETLEGADISQSSRVELIALGTSSTEREQLQEFKAALGERANVDLYTPEDTEELNDVASEAAAQTDAVNEVLEDEREAGLYPQK